MKKKQLLKLLKRQTDCTQSALDLLAAAYRQDDRDHGIESAEDEGGPDPRHPALVLPEHPKPLKAHKQVEPEPVFLRMYQ